MTILYLDCPSGASGDMILGALLDAGAPEELVRAALDTLPVAGWKLEVSTVVRGGLRATRAEVSTNEDTSLGRRYKDVVRVIERAPLPESIARRALDTFGLLAEAEARIHRVSPADVHLHEVGALDSLVDVVGCCAALEHFGASRVVTSPIATGTGTLASAHGELPLPAPAVTEILQGRGAILWGRGGHELVTPTAAALLGVFSTEFGTMPPLRLDASGYGAGARDLTHPNILRVLVGTEPDGELRPAVLLEANVDDMNPELVPHVLDSLLEGGAQDAWVTPALMKKGRPGVTLSVLATPELVHRLIDIVYRETTTLGVRLATMTKNELERRWVTVEVEGQAVRVKQGLREGRIVNAAPEHDDAVAAARASGLPLKRVYALALVAAERNG